MRLIRDEIRESLGVQTFSGRGEERSPVQELRGAVKGEGTSGQMLTLALSSELESGDAPSPCDGSAKPG